MRAMAMVFAMALAVECSAAEPTAGAPVDEPTGQYRRLVGDTGAVVTAEFSADGKRILSGCEDGTLRLWDIEEGRELRAFRGHSGQINGVSLSADGALALSASMDGTMRLWDVEAGQELRRFDSPEIVHSVALSPDGTKAWSAGRDKIVRLWAVRSGDELRRLVGHTGLVESISVPGERRLVLSGGHDKVALLWNAETGQLLQEFCADELNAAVAGDVHCAALSNNSQFAVTAGAGNVLCCWDTKNGKSLWHAAAHRGDIFSVAISPNDQFVLSGGIDGILRLWSIAESAVVVHRFAGHGDIIRCVRFSPDGRFALSASGGRYEEGKYVTGKDHSIRIWQLAEPQN